MLEAEARRLFEEARALALALHKNQRYGDQPYEHHLLAVVGVLERFGANLEDESTAPVLIAAWLHDGLEDTPLTRDEVEMRFGREVAELVWRVTDEPGATRKERKVATYEKTRRTEASIILKLADRIANVEASMADNSSLSRMYRREQDDFRAALFTPAQHEITKRLWAHLEKLLESSMGG